MIARVNIHFSTLFIVPISERSKAKVKLRSESLSSKIMIQLMNNTFTS